MHFLATIGRHAKSSPPLHPSLTLIAASRQLAGFHGGVGFLGKLVPQPAALGKKEKIARTYTVARAYGVPEGQFPACLT